MDAKQAYDLLGTIEQNPIVKFVRDRVATFCGVTDAPPDTWSLELPEPWSLELPDDYEPAINWLLSASRRGVFQQ